MGFVSIPTTVAPGRVVATMELNEEELRVSLDLLKVAVNAYCQQPVIPAIPVQQPAQRNAPVQTQVEI